MPEALNGVGVSIHAETHMSKLLALSQAKINKNNFRYHKYLERITLFN